MISAVVFKMLCETVKVKCLEATARSPIKHFSNSQVVYSDSIPERPLATTRFIFSEFRQLETPGNLFDDGQIAVSQKLYSNSPPNQKTSSPLLLGSSAPRLEESKYVAMYIITE